MACYCAEFDCSYNSHDLNEAERVALILKGTEGKRLTYRRTDNSSPKLYESPRQIGKPRKR